MAKKNRSTLKRYFREGALPTADQFADLVDSTLNTIDEGFDKSAEDGFEISLIGQHDKLISFFRNSVDQNAVWAVSYDRDSDRLSFVKPSAVDDVTSTLTLAPQGLVGVNKNDPGWQLDVGGVVAAQGRIGANPDNRCTIPADGEWHDITPDLTGCQALEIMAGVGNKGTGKYALLKAEAFNAFNPYGLFFNFLNLKKRIKYHQAWYLSRSDKIKLRWAGKGRDYTLQMRTQSNYGDDIKIRYYITRLWFDADMSESWEQQAAAQTNVSAGKNG